MLKNYCECMNMIKKNILKILFSVFIIINILILFGFQDGDYERIKINSSWEIKYQDHTYYCDSLSQQSLPSVKKGEHIEISTILSEYPFEQAILDFVTHCSVIKVYIDHTLIYEYGEKEALNGGLVGSGNMYVPLPENYAGKNLTIIIDVCEDGVFTKISDVYIQDIKYYVQNILYHNIPTLFIVTILLVLGIIILPLTTLFAGINQLTTKGFLCISGFSVVTAIWLICYTSIGLCFTNDYRTLSILAYICLYSIPVFFCFFIYKLMNHKWSKVILRFSSVTFLLFDIIAILLNHFDIAHFPKTLSIFHVLMLLGCMIIFSIICVELFRERQKEVKILFIGIILFILIIFAEMARYWVDKYFITNVITEGTLLPMGIFVLIVGMTISLGLRLKKEISIKLETETLNYMAHTDALTKISNRLSCEETFHLLDTNKKPVVVINFDLNSFKKINDTFGHHTGDKVLVAFADILKDVFSDSGFIGRMGGDEFIVVLDYIKEEKILLYIEKMQKKIAEYNRNNKNEDYELSMSYGWADNLNCIETSIWRVYESADQKMYQYKKETKQKLQ